MGNRLYDSLDKIKREMRTVSSKLDEINDKVDKINPKIELVEIYLISPMPDEVTKDTVYSELYQEMRRFRDYHLNVATWYTVILLALLGGIFTIKYSSDFSNISRLFTNLLVKFLIIGFTILLGFSGIFSILFASDRHDQIREYVNTHLEPTWKPKFEPHKFKIFNLNFTPTGFMILTIIILMLSIIVIVLLELKQCIVF